MTTVPATRLWLRGAVVAVGVAVLAATPLADLAATPPPAVRAAVDPTLADRLERGGVELVVVRAAPGALDDVLAAARAQQIEVRSRLELVDGFAARMDADRLATLAARRDVVSITADHVAEFHGEAGTLLGDDWFEQTVRADVAAGLGLDGAGVGIAVVDSGVAGDHPALVGSVAPGVDTSGDGDGIDRHGHGTFLSGLAVGTGATSPGDRADGIAPGAHVVPVKVGGAHGVRLVDLLEGLQWIHFHRDSHDIDVVNLSFGTRSPQSHSVDPLNFAVQRLWADGLVVVVSAGNTGQDGASTVTKPGDDPFVITVGSTDSMGTTDRDDDVVPSFSAQGPTLADGIAKPDLVAPGRSLVGPFGPLSAVATATEYHVADGWVRASGTSMSAALVSGAAALVLQAHPDWTPDQVKGALLDSAAPGPVGDPNVDGHGLLDVAAAVAVQAPSDPNDGIPFGTGSGSLAQTLGLPDQLVVDVKVRECVLLVCAWVDAQVTAPSSALVFHDATAYLTDWNAEAWDDTQWQGNQWQGNQWQGNQWQGNQWQGNQWQGNQWQGNDW